MIVDTSALVAIVLGEPGWEKLRRAILIGPSRIPAPALTELRLVTGGRNEDDDKRANALIEVLLRDGIEIIPFESRHAKLSVHARDRFGKGNGKGGLLNFGDLMVYAVASDRGEPLLCTGRDFASTDLQIHPASRLDP